MDSFILQVCKLFSESNPVEINTLGRGLINDTFLVKTNRQSFVLQRINSQVFPNPELIMENLMLLNQYDNQKNTSAIKLQIPRVLKTHDQNAYYVDKQKNYWRALEYIGNTTSKESINNLHEAKEVGIALGNFHGLFCDANINSFHDSLPGFHITPQYYEHYLQVEKLSDEPDKSEKLTFCRKFIDAFQDKINVLEEAKQKGFLSERIIHGDPKLNNFLFDNQTNKIISLIDLDTVKPGLIHYDIADCLRSCCHDVETNSFDLERCAALLSNYLQQVHCFFTELDYVYLYPAIQLIPFELGLRFFTDYLEGNRYFKVDSVDQNLYRAYSQFCLCENITRQEQEIKRLIETQSQL